MKKISKLIILIIVSIITISCSSIGTSSQNENLPKGMVPGLWMPENNEFEGAMGFIFFNDGFFMEFDGETGSYTLVDENKISISPWGNFVVKVEKPNKKITLANDDGFLTLDLMVEDTSSGNLEKDILGTWIVYENSCEDHFRKDVSSSYEGEWTFERNGTLTMSNGDEPYHLTYTFVEDKAFIKNPENDWTAPMGVHSLGDLLIIVLPLDPYCLIKK